eukprot:tig00001029_g6420.t1
MQSTSAFCQPAAVAAGAAFADSGRLSRPAPSLSPSPSLYTGTRRRAASQQRTPRGAFLAAGSCPRFFAYDEASRRGAQPQREQLNTASQTPAFDRDGESVDATAPLLSTEPMPAVAPDFDAGSRDAVMMHVSSDADERSFWINRVLVSSLVRLIDAVYGTRPYARFYCLETVARVPYFSYLSVLHLYESIGLWRSADWLKVHFAQSWNEMHHLLIMESLGGNARWLDRFVAGHAAVVYYWITTAMYVLQPAAAYNFAELVEAHAVESYSHFLEKHGPELRGQPAPQVALEYYNARGEEAFLFQAFQTGSEGRRSPSVRDLYDVFTEIRRDEEQHRDTLILCQERLSAGSGLPEGGAPLTPPARDVDAKSVSDKSG